MVHTRSFRQHHVEVRRLIATISDLLDAEAISHDSAPVAAAIRELFGKFTQHLAMEDGILYPRMMSSKNPECSSTARRFQEEMGGLKPEFGQFKGRWQTRAAIAGDPAGFVAETRVLVRALATRIRREEDELYPLGDEHIQEPAPASVLPYARPASLPGEKDLFAALPAAIENGQILPYFQPKFDLFRQRITGFEALARWIHPEWGMIPPGYFIPYAERNGLMDAIGGSILRQACREAAVWRDAGVAASVAVNVSPVQLRRGGAFEAEVLAVLSESDLPPRLLELEITEGVLMDEVARAAINRLIACRINVAIDDFGTGYSSLAYLRQFPAKTLKIDKSFVDDVPGALDSSLLIASVIRIARTFGMVVVAEGVETSEQMQALALGQCDMVQGYAFSPPVPAEAARDLLLAQEPL
ncbi:MAG: EAL domain-containing protein [Rhodospirillales bacterium]|nr:EAL domain-containing protein [Rhodospirillales bacterium]